MNTTTPRSLAKIIAAAAIGLGIFSPAAHAWVYPEHRDIAVLAVQKLDPERRAEMDRLWRSARTEHATRLCATPADGQQGVAPQCIDWAAMPAIAGDHSCSSKNMLDNVLKSAWILQVADVAAQLKVDLAPIPVTPTARQQSASNDLGAQMQREFASNTIRAERINALRTSDTRLQRADPEYATRAGSNNAHFLLARPSNEITAQEYSKLTLNVGAEISAVGVYGWYHLSALQKATRLANEKLSPADQQTLALSMLADEAFALHFLEDVFAAGHVAGSWGDTSQRKGTHDFYNEAGLEAFLWAGTSNSIVLMGDAHMRPQDADRAAIAARKSLEQLLDHASGRIRPHMLPHTPAAPMAADDFNVCQNNTLIQRPTELRATPAAFEIAYEVLGPTPIPGLGQGLGSMPRFRAEVGPFIGLTGSLSANFLNGGFIDGQNEKGWLLGSDLSVRGGFGIDGLIGESGDGLVFASLGITGNSPSSNKFSSSQQAQMGGGLAAAIPARLGVSTRLRMPFYLIPGDLLLLSPMYFFNPEAYTAMAVTAGNGGLIPWQLGMMTGIGRFQFVLGREVGITFFGTGGEDSLFAPSSASATTPTLVNFKSTSIDLPILEYRPYRAFDTRQSSALVFQLFAGADIPHNATVLSPSGAATPNMNTVYSVGLRMIFDWRRYF